MQNMAESLILQIVPGQFTVSDEQIAPETLIHFLLTHCVGFRTN